jgi:magnesium transporter
VLNKLIQIKKEVLHLRQIIGPQREVLARFAAGDFKLIRVHLVPYYRDVYDGLFHIYELSQNYADSLTGILQVYLSLTSNQTGEVVKLLTLITVITTPLMMIGTWYGMNFEEMPEVKPGGYWVAVTVMLVSTALTYWYFKRKKWI